MTGSTKYIFVTGGVTSSLGKGIISASLAKLLQARGFRARKTFDGVSEWQAAGLPVQRT